SGPPRPRWRRWSRRSRAPPAGHRRPLFLLLAERETGRRSGGAAPSVPLGWGLDSITAGVAAPSAPPPSAGIRVFLPPIRYCCTTLITFVVSQYSTSPAGTAEKKNRYISGMNAIMRFICCCCGSAVGITIIRCTTYDSAVITSSSGPGTWTPKTVRKFVALIRFASASGLVLASIGGHENGTPL